MPRSDGRGRAAARAPPSADEKFPAVAGRTTTLPTRRRFCAYDPCGSKRVVVLSRSLVESFRAVRLLLVADRECGLVNALRRMGFASVYRVGDAEAARMVCDREPVDACIVVLPPAVPDERPSLSVETRPPGAGRIPALLIADAATPYVRRAARRAGYGGVAGRGLPPRMVYRSIAALLQAARSGGDGGSSPSRHRAAATFVAPGTREGAGKLKLH